jgi:retinol dehydrogenase 12
MQKRDLEGKVIAITGANIGIGRAVATALALRGAQLRLLCRSLGRVGPIVEELREHTDVAAIECDLAQLASVRTAAAQLLARDEPLDVLVNNAGIGGQRGVTADGFELHFGTNHVGHFLLTTLLLDRLKASGPSRIVHVASGSHYKARGLDWDAVRAPTASYTGMPEYAMSKLANVLFSAELARRLEDTQVTSYAVNPGRVASNIWQRMPWPVRPLFKLTMLSTERGAHSTLRAAVDLAGSGGYFDHRAIRQPPSVPARDPRLAAELWERSVEWTAAPVRAARISAASLVAVANGASASA